MEIINLSGWCLLLVWIAGIFVKLYFFPSAKDRELYDK